jgi:D-xylose transport system permease protein
VAVVLVWLAFAIATDGIFLSPRNFSNLIRQTAISGILAVGMLLVMIAGQIDFSVGSLVGLSGMVAVLAQVSWHWGLIGSLLAGLFTGLAVGAFQGVLTAYVGIPSFIVTIGGLLVWRGVARGLSSGNTYPVAVRSFKTLGQSYLSPATGIALAVAAVLATAWLVMRQNQLRGSQSVPHWTPISLVLRMVVPSALIIGCVYALNGYAGVPVPAVILLAVAAAVALGLHNTAAGRTLYAVGDHSETARSSAVITRSHVTSAFCVLGLLAALVGMIYSARVGSASPDAGALLEIDAIAACVIGGASLAGGRGTVLGALLGALFMASLDSGMSLKNVPDFVQAIVKGSILVAAVGLDTMVRRKD